MQRIAEGRTAEVFALDDDRVVKVDRPGFEGLSTYEAEVLVPLGAAGVPAPEVHGTMTVDGRPGVVLQRLVGPTLTDLIRGGGDVEALATEFVDLHCRVNAMSVDGFGNLVDRLHGEIELSGLSESTRLDLLERLHQSTGPVGLCHLDLFPDNVIVTDDGWVVIDWLTVGTGPTVADFARTLLLWRHVVDPSIVAFMRGVRAEGAARRGLADEEIESWIRVTAGARLAEGFEGAYATSLRQIAEGD